MHSQIVSVTTADHVRLHGRSLGSDDAGAARSNRGTAILVHGLAGNFYSSKLLEFVALKVVQAGFRALIINTRGHDVLNTVSRSGQTAHLGAAYEDVADCTFDLAAWVRLARSRFDGPVTLVGHSLGAIKSLYAQVHCEEPLADQLVALSATRLNHEALKESPKGDRFQALYEQSVQWVNEGRGDDLMRIDFPFPTWMSAGAYSRKYGPANRFDWISFVDRIDVPTLLIFGGKELDQNPAFQGLRERVQGMREQFPQVETMEVPEANHFYAGQFAETSKLLLDWMDRRQ